MKSMFPIPSPSDSKTHWRQWAKGFRATEDVERLSSELLQTFSTLPCLSRASKTDHLLLYAPLPDEFDPTPLLNTFLGTCYLPRITDYKKRRMQFHQVTPNTPLVTHPTLHLKEPPITAPVFSVDSFFSQETSHMVLLIPALATDHQGHRLGYGGGFYDKFLDDLYAQTVRSDQQLLNRMTTACWMSDNRHVKQLPTEPTDRPVQWVITPIQSIQIVQTISP